MMTSVVVLFDNTNIKLKFSRHTMTWMRNLASHYSKMRKKYPDDHLMIVFDIDDTIVDIKIPLLFVLKKYDHLNGTDYFTQFTIEDIVFEEWTIQTWLPTVVDNEDIQNNIVQFVREQMWREETILLSHRPFQGVLEVIRWFQIQDNVEIGLNTGRSEDLREITLKSLNTLGKEFRVNFDTDLLYMNPHPNEEGKDVVSYKTRGIRYFEEQGYRVIAFIDNEPANLKAVADAIDDDELLLLHADTMFSTQAKLRPKRVVVGSDYNIADLIDRNMLPEHIEFVWNGINSIEVFEEYRNSNVHWGEIDARRHPLDNRIVLKHGSFDTPEFGDDGYITFREMLDMLTEIDRGIKLVLKEDDGLLDEILTILSNRDDLPRLWFDLVFEIFDEDGLEQIRTIFPEAIISTRVDFLVPLLSQFPDYVKNITDELVERGFTQFSISMKTYNKELFIEQMDTWGYDLNIRDVYTLQEFLQAILYLPESIVSSFNY